MKQKIVSENTHLSKGSESLSPVGREIAELSERAEFLQSVAEANPGAVYVLDLMTRSNIYSSHAIESILDHSEVEIVNLGSNIVPSLVHPEDLTGYEQHLIAVTQLNNGESCECEYRVRDRIGNWHWLKSCDAVFKRNGDGKVIQIIGTATEISEMKRMGELLRDSEHVQRMGKHVGKLGIAQIDHVTGLMHFDPESAEMFGLDANTVSAPLEHIHGMYHPDDQAMLLPLLKLSMDPTGDGTLRAEHRIIRPNGEVSWHSIEMQTFFDRASIKHFPERSLVMIRDITESKVAETELHRQASMLKLSYDPSFSWTAEGGIASWNQGCEQLYGYTAAEAIGRSSHDLLNTIHPVPVAEIINTLEKEGHWSGELRHTTKDGVELTVQSRHHLTEFPGQGLVLETNRDVTESNRIERQLQENEARMRLATEATSVGIWEWNILTGAIRWDAEMFRIYGIEPTPDGFVQYSEWLGFVHPDDLPEQERVLQDMAQRGGRNEREYRIQRKSDGEVRQIEAVQTVRTKGKELAEWVVGTNLDITDRKRIEQQLQENESRMRLATEATGVGIWEWNILTGEIRWDAAMFRIYGIEPTPDGFIQYNDWLRFVHPDDLPEHERVLQGLAQNGGSSQREFRIHRISDGESRQIEAVETVRSNDQDLSLWVVGTNLDITERKLMEETLRDDDQRKDEFMATLAHELRNPMAAISGAIQLLQVAKQSPELSIEITDILKRQSAQLNRLIDDLLDVSRIRQGKIDLKMAPVSLTDIAKEAVESVKALCDSMGHKLELNFSPEPVMVAGDRARLIQVISNVLNNSCKFTNHGGQITLSIHREGDYAVVKVSDNGIGIEPEQLPHLFEVFSQVDTTPMRRSSGLGIGLSLVKRLTEMHGGTVKATSKGIGLGSQFTVRLPLATDNDIAKNKQAMEEDAPHEILVQRVLVIDDNEDAARCLALILEDEDHSLKVVNDGEQGVDLAKVFSPHIILLDLGLPGIDGYEVCRRIRRLDQSPRPVIVAVTGWGQERDRANTKVAGFDFHLVKPLNFDELRKILLEAAENLAAGLAMSK